mmetsp:Transcript_1897/g.4787  ORF Transcript_1897/g.4787 Transcript_1897/m.4787 type:complete len:218 (-) Transcript_1897:1928-2581(-)
MMTSTGGALHALLSSSSTSLICGSFPISMGTWVMRLRLRRSSVSCVQRQRFLGTVVRWFSERSRRFILCSFPIDGGSAWISLWLLKNSSRLPSSPISAGRSVILLKLMLSVTRSVRFLISGGTSPILLCPALRCTSLVQVWKKSSGKAPIWFSSILTFTRSVQRPRVLGNTAMSLYERSMSVSCVHMPMAWSTLVILLRLRFSVTSVTLLPICSGSL